MTTPLTIAVLLAVAIGPALFWMWYFYHKDRYEPEPLSWIVKIFLIGVLVVIPIAIGESIAGIFFSEFAIFVIIGPVMEEFGKFFVVKRYVYPTSEFNEPVDGIIYASPLHLDLQLLKIFCIFSLFPLRNWPLFSGW
jgi:RsiW-degrading membrane proteinase PrsW (M82 family)